MVGYFEKQKQLRAAKDEEDTCMVCNNFLVMAFQAMGGGPGKDGIVARSQLEKVIAEDFGLTIDIKVFIKLKIRKWLMR